MTQNVTNNFVQDHMPPTEQWPQFINMDFMQENTPYNCVEILLDNAIKEGFGNKVALHGPDEDWTYQELLDKTNQIAHVLKDNFDLIPGTPVLLRSANNPMLVACWLAVVKAGGIVVTTIAMLRAKEIKAVARQCKASLALCDERLKEDMAAATEEIDHLSHVLYFNGAGDLEQRMTTKPKVFNTYPAEETDIAMIAFTSGTTGKPKAALHSHHAILAVCETFSKQVVKPTSKDVFSGTPPLGFVYGLGGLLLFPLYARSSVVLLEDVRANSLITAIDKFKVTVLFTAPTAYKVMLENYDSDKLASLQKCVSAGEALPAFVTQGWIDKADIRLIDGIGSTELLHIFISVQNNDDPVGSLGKAVPGYEAYVVDETGTPVDVGDVGYLAVRGPTGCRYLNDDRQRKYVIEGWNVTGDTAKMDEDGFFWYQARTDGMIISSGYNIAAPEVEHTVTRHTAVAECGVIGVPDSQRGNIVRAYIVLKEGYSPSHELIKDIQEFAKQEGAPYKYPRSVKFIESIPRTSTGKVQHFALREIAKTDEEY
ncbi:2-aminobenzoate-CoA ligase [Candidatus Wolfebacteria bacterium]|nr:MAG: 2-aminobenzoate-CoA ligase [Candidatus Wolfebacteria bacterium]